MANLTPSVVLLAVGAASLFSTMVNRVWQKEEARHRIIAVIFGLICIAFGLLGLLGYVDIHD
jgi:hypothetical protein